jgi:competence ComEA-like helix-hairpin-helix protein
MFNRSEKIALLFLCASLVVGGAVSIVDSYDPDRLVDFRVARAAVQVPTAEDTPLEAVALIRIDVNTATAKRIIAYRTEHGRFAALEALRHVKGIGPRTVEKLEPLATVESSQQANP